MVNQRNRWWDLLAKTIRKRDEHQCRRCGATPEMEAGGKSPQITFEGFPDDPEVLKQIVRNFPVHHLFAEDDVGNEHDAHHPTNLVTLCAGCHQQLEPRNIGKQLSACGIAEIENLELEVELRRRVRQKIRRLNEKPETEIGELPSPTIEFLHGLTDQTRIEDFLGQLPHPTSLTLRGSLVEGGACP